jgi:acetylornithine deacetylase/succinyl-diaminopimelate desuccinylase-like protein
MIENVLNQLSISREEQLDRLLRYIRQPSVAATGEGVDDMIRMLRDDIVELGGDGEIVEGDEYPIVYGKFDEGASRTVLVHTMYDVAPAEEPEWIVPPFDAKPMDWRDYGECLVARGTEDTKSQVALIYNVIAAYRAAGVPLPVNVILVQEASELGSGSIGGFVEDHLDELQKADVAWWPLVTARPDGTPVMYLGAKGGVYGKLRCRTGSWGGPTQTDLHSVNTNWIANPAHRLVQALASLKSDDDREVLLPGFYGEQQPPSEADLELLRKLADELDPQRLLDIVGAKRFKQDSVHEALYDYCFTSELNISGLRSGEVLEDAHKCIITQEATASIDIRLLEAQSISDVTNALERHLENEFPEVEWELLNSYEGDRVPVDNWAVQAMLSTYESMAKTPEVWPTTAAAIANALWTRKVGVPWLMGAPAHAEGKHAANEYIIIDTFYDACEFGARLLDKLGAS